MTLDPPNQLDIKRRRTTFTPVVIADERQKASAFRHVEGEGVHMDGPDGHSFFMHVRDQLHHS
jgi:hypothetical protein